jgi:hypothetical protein
MRKLIDKLYKNIFLLLKRFYCFFHSPKSASETIFAAGMQRSGTNMLMDILEKSFETDVYHEHDVRAFNNYEMREKSVIQKLEKASCAPKFVIKALFELQDLRSLMEVFHPAKVIWIVRDYDDVVNSMLNSFPDMENLVLRIMHDNSDEWLGRGMTEKTRNDLIPLVEPGMGDASAAATHWYLRNMLFFDQSFETDMRVLLVSYEKLVIKPEIEVKRICEFIGIHYRPGMSRNIFCSSISLRQKPVIDSRIRNLCNQLYLRFKEIN